MRAVDHWHDVALRNIAIVADRPPRLLLKPRMLQSLLGRNSLPPVAGQQAQQQILALG